MPVGLPAVPRPHPPSASATTRGQAAAEACLARLARLALAALRRTAAGWGIHSRPARPGQGPAWSQGGQTCKQGGDEWRLGTDTQYVHVCERMLACVCVCVCLCAHIAQFGVSQRGSAPRTARPEVALPFLQGSDETTQVNAFSNLLTLLCLNPED